MLEHISNPLFLNKGSKIDVPPKRVWLPGGIQVVSECRFANHDTIQFAKQISFNCTSYLFTSEFRVAYHATPSLRQNNPFRPSRRLFCFEGHSFALRRTLKRSQVFVHQSFRIFKMAFLKRLMCICHFEQADDGTSHVGCGTAGKVKYEEPYDGACVKEKRRRIKCFVPCHGFKSHSKTAPASSGEDSTTPVEAQTSIQATVVIDDTPSPTVSFRHRHKHSKSYSSVSSMGKRLVEKLADEVVEDFMASEMLFALPFSFQETNQQETPRFESKMERETSAETMMDTALEDMHPCGNKLGEGEDEFIDSAWESSAESFKEKRALYEHRNRSIKQPFGTETAEMKPSLELDLESPDLLESKQTQWNHPTPRRTSDRDGCDSVTNPILSKEQNWIMDDTGQSVHSSVQDGPSQLTSTSGKTQFLKGDCVVRRVFRASQLAQLEEESSESSVISTEFLSNPKNHLEDERNNRRTHL